VVCGLASTKIELDGVHRSGATSPGLVPDHRFPSRSRLAGVQRGLGFDRVRDRDKPAGQSDENRPRLVLPDGAVLPSGLWVPRGSLDEPGRTTRGLRLSEIEGTPLAVVRRGQPDLTDVLFRAVPEESDLGLTTTSPQELRAMVAELPFDGAAVFYARLAAEAWHAGYDRDAQLRIAKELFPTSAASSASSSRGPTGSTRTLSADHPRREVAPTCVAFRSCCVGLWS
jgi:hypothetical protein